MATELPTLDLTELSGSRRAEAAGYAVECFARHGFVLVGGHGIDATLFEAVHAQTERLFALPLEHKRACAPEHARGLSGYVLGDPNERPEDDADKCELWQIQRPVPADRRDPAIPDNVWPDGAPGLREPALRLFGALDGCATAVLGGLDAGLDLGGELTDTAIDGWAILRLMRYPSWRGAAAPERPRASAHDDVCLLTCYTGGSTAGLEVMLDDGSWQPVPAGERWLLVGAGTMLQAATNGIVRPATHRVLHRDDAPGIRYATPFFLLPRPRASVGPRPAMIRRSGGFARYPERTAARMLGEATGWGDDEATADHERWRVESPAPDPRTRRIAAHDDPSLSFREADVHELGELAAALPKILAGEDNVLIVRRALSPVQAHAMHERLRRGTPALREVPFPPAFHASYFGGNLDMDGEDLTGYLDAAERFEHDAAVLGGPELDLSDALPRLFGALSGGLPIARPRGPDGRPYLLLSVRELREQGHIPPHCECEQLGRGPYHDLGPRLDPATLLSFYVMIAPPEAGGELVIHDLRWDEVKGQHVQHGRTEVRSLLASAPRPTLTIRTLPGDLLIFDGGRFIHEVRPVTAGRRWTFGGFLGLDRDRTTVLQWA